MDTDFVTPATQVDITVESVPLTLCRPGIPPHHAVNISLVRCDVLNDLDVVNAAGVDRTGLFVWRGARDFVQLYEAFCRHLVATSEAPPCCPFDVAVELGAGSGLGTLTVAVCTAAAFPDGSTATTSASHPGLCVATDFWPPSLSLLEKSVQATRTSLPPSVRLLPVRTHTLDWLHWTTATTAEKVRALDAVMGVDRSAAHRLPRVWLYGLDVVYPDTRTAVLLALLTCVRQLWQAYRAPTADDDDHTKDTFTGLFTDTFVSSFVERDAGVTLRRLFAACVVTEMDVVPLASPFTAAASSPPLLESIPLLVGRGLSSWAACSDAAWAALRHGLHAMLATTTATPDGCLSPLALAVAGGGSWLFAFRPRRERHGTFVVVPADAAEARVASLLAAPEALHEAMCDDAIWRPWTTLLPWLFAGPPLPPGLPLHELALCAEWEGTAEDGAPFIRSERVAARLAHVAAVDVNDTFLMEGFDL